MGINAAEADLFRSGAMHHRDGVTVRDADYAAREVSGKEQVAEQNQT